mmetsp:Transcript_89357/g.158540  ORF Transcript_89357/g.158540 Transcript_89357/m.158540 type:complete len:84 (+) Transcript_89357:1662-1913(+)
MLKVTVAPAEIEPDVNVSVNVVPAPFTDVVPYDPPPEADTVGDELATKIAELNARVTVSVLAVLIPVANVALAFNVVGVVAST